jgi:hypothetical protein
MKKLPWIVACAVLTAACSDTTAPPRTGSDAPRFAASPGNTRCVGTLPPGTYQNVTVPDGETCVLENSIVLGNVTAREGSRLTLFNVRVDENVHGLKAAVVHVFGGGSVGENIHIQGADSPNVLFSVFINQIHVMRGNIHLEENNAGGIGVINNTVSLGNILIQGNDAAFFNTIQDNRIGQNLIVMDNSGPGPKAVNNNFLEGKVICFRNEPPFVGGPNFAESSEGQCF